MDSQAFLLYIACLTTFSVARITWRLMKEWLVHNELESCDGSGHGMVVDTVPTFAVETEASREKSVMITGLRLGFEPENEPLPLCWTLGTKVLCKQNHGAQSV
jgi:hypothetical protein